MTPKKYDISSLFLIDHPPFVRMVLFYLKQHGITEFGGVDYFSQIDCEDIEQSLYESGFKGKGYIDKLVIDDWNLNKRFSQLSLTGFAYNFQRNYGNWRVEKYTSKEVQKRNKKVKDKYYELVSVIDRLQGYLDTSELRLRIDGAYINREIFHQCLTPFCMMSLACDELGNFSIIYALASNIRNLITDLLASILEKRISDSESTELKGYIIPTVFTNEFKDRFTKAKEYSIFNKNDFPIYVLRNKFKKL